MIDLQPARIFISMNVSRNLRSITYNQQLLPLWNAMSSHYLHANIAKIKKNVQFSHYVMSF